MKLALLAAFLSLPAAAQIECHYSRLADSVVKQILSTVPRDVHVYRADCVNMGAAEARMFPSRIAFEAAAVAPMQDPEASLYAASNYRKSRWWVVLLKGVGMASGYAGPALLGLTAAGVAIPDIASTLAGGSAAGAALFNGLHDGAARLTVPTTWLRDGLPEIILKPGEPVPYLIALGGTPPGTFARTVGAQVMVSIETLVPTTTHPQIPEPPDRMALAEAALENAWAAYRASPTPETRSALNTAAKERIAIGVPQ